MKSLNSPLSSDKSSDINNGYSINHWWFVAMCKFSGFPFLPRHNLNSLRSNEVMPFAFDSSFRPVNSIKCFLNDARSLCLSISIVNRLRCLSNASFFPWWKKLIITRIIDMTFDTTTLDLLALSLPSSRQRTLAPLDGESDCFDFGVTDSSSQSSLNLNFKLPAVFWGFWRFSSHFARFWLSIQPYSRKVDSSRLPLTVNSYFFHNT